MSYSLGDNDSRTAARAIVLNRIRLLAASEAGHYVQGDERLDDDTYTSSVVMAGAAFVSIANEHEWMGVGVGGNPVMHMTAEATVDESDLRSRIDAIKRNSGLEKALAKAERRFSAMLSGVSDPGAAIEANQILQNLDATIHQVQRQFAHGELSTRSADEQSGRIVTQTIESIEKDIFGPVMAGTKIDYTHMQFSRGKDHVLLILAQWETPVMALPAAQEFTKKLHDGWDFSLSPYGYAVPLNTASGITLSVLDRAEGTVYLTDQHCVTPLPENKSVSTHPVVFLHSGLDRALGESVASHLSNVGMHVDFKVMSGEKILRQLSAPLASPPRFGAAFFQIAAAGNAQVEFCLSETDMESITSISATVSQSSIH